MKVFVTGGTGFLGYYLVQECIKKNFDITCFVRKNALKVKKELCYSFTKQGVKLVVGDVTDSVSLSNAFKKKHYDLIFHLAGIYATHDETIQVNVDGTKNILTAFVENQNYPKRFVFMSSTGAMGPVKSTKPLNEETECKPENVYEISKYDAENVVKNFGEINHVIIRAPRIFGANDPQNTFSFFKKFAKIGVFPIISNFPFSLVYVKNLIHGILLASKKKKAVRNTYIIADKKSYATKEIALAIADTLKIKRRTYLTIPRTAVKTISLITNSYRYGLHNVRYSIEKAKKDLHYKPKYELLDAMKETF